MSVENFEVADNDSKDDSIIKRVALEIYHQQGAKFDISDQNDEFSFGEITIYHQIGNAFLQYEIAIREADKTDFVSSDTIRLV